MVKSFDILAIDHDPVHGRNLEKILTEQKKSYKITKSSKEALKLLESSEYQFNYIFIDLSMPKISGFDLLQQIKGFAPQIPCIMISSSSSINHIIETMRAGAVDFIIKPLTSERIDIALSNAQQVNILKKQSALLSNDNSLAKQQKIHVCNLITHSKEMKRVLKLAERAAPSNIPVLIDGESGTGKEVMANAIVNTSLRKNAPFITVNCGALPPNLMESILFGHEKGAFTGANEKHTGKFLEANNGTIFLDEVGELPLDMQVKLLRVLQNGDLDAVGSKKSIKIDVRVISATNRDLSQMIREGTFREDLFYRLNVFQITLPPLRKRPEDLTQFMQYFVDKISAEEGKQIQGFNTQALNAMTTYHWPGNIRQLENIIFRAVVLCDETHITCEDLPQFIVNAHLYQGDNDRRKQKRIDRRMN